MIAVENKFIASKEETAYIKLGKEKGFGALESEVIFRDLCMSCGLCESICPEEVIKVEEQPSLIGECTNCGDCLIYCPRSFFPQDIIEERLFEDAKEDDELIGKYILKTAVRAKDNNIVKVSQDGGFVTALLCYALDKGIIDGAIVSIATEKWYAKPFLATSIEDIIKAAGSKYTPSPNLQKLKEAKKELNSIAVVGTPCQIQGIRKLQLFDNELSKIIKFTVGLFCKSSFNTSLLKEFEREYNINLENVSKFDIKGKYFRVFENGDLTKIPMKKISKFARVACKYCFDFSAKYADFSVGSVGSPDSYSTVIVRSKLANDILNMLLSDEVIETAEVEDEPIKKLCEMKIRDANKKVKAKIMEELPLALRQFIR